jgi:hypothetical protein
MRTAGRLAELIPMVAFAVAAAGAQGTVCDSPCKFLQLPLIVRPGRTTMLTDPRVDMLLQFYKPYMFYQVDTVAMLISSSRPTYPSELTKRDNGMVIGLIIVDSIGHAVPGSMQLLYSSDSLFSEAAREWVASMRYVPARLGERRVAQIVRQSFAFVPPR